MPAVFAAVVGWDAHQCYLGKEAAIFAFPGKRSLPVACVHYTDSKSQTGCMSAAAAAAAVAGRDWSC